MAPDIENVTFAQAQLEAIAAALGHTNQRLTGNEIGQLLSAAKINDCDPSMTRRHRLINAFARAPEPSL